MGDDDRMDDEECLEKNSYTNTGRAKNMQYELKPKNKKFD